MESEEEKAASPPKTVRALAIEAMHASPVYELGIEEVVANGTSLLTDITYELSLSCFHALTILVGIPTTEEYDLDGLTALSLVGSETGVSERRGKLDQWKYAEHGDDQSYYTLGSLALRSDTTVNPRMLEASKSHFMMYQSGISKIDCFGFRFKDSADYVGDPDGNPAKVDEDLFDLCGLADWDGISCNDVTLYAQRLEAIQHDDYFNSQSIYSWLNAIFSYFDFVQKCSVFVAACKYSYA
jgi:hypothetical protein